MAIERERKFLYIDKGRSFGSCKVLQQGYLMLDGDRQLRVRIISSEEAFICYKQSLNDTDKIEIEREIDLDEGEQLFATAPYKLTKCRWKTTFNGNSVDIDLYKDGLCVVEIEFENELTELPDYCGEEITGVKKYSNIALVIAETEKDLEESTLGGMNKYLCATRIGGEMESPEITYSNYDVITAVNEKEALKLYDKKYNNTYYTGVVMAVKIFTKVKALNNDITISWLNKLQNEY